MPQNRPIIFKTSRPRRLKERGRGVASRDAQIDDRVVETVYVLSPLWPSIFSGVPTEREVVRRVFLI